MSITVIAACSTADAVPASAATEFTTTGPFVLYADYFEVGQNAVLYRKGPSGDFLPATNVDGGIVVSALPNTAYVDAAGIFRIKKDATSASAKVGYEVV